MKLILFSINFFICLVSISFADTTTVIVFEQNYIHFGGDIQNTADHFTELDNGRVLSRKITLPEFLNPVSITAHLDIDTNGDPWDRAGSVYLEIPDMGQIELLKFITGFGGHSVLQEDITYLAPSLKGEVTIRAFVDTWVEQGWIFDFSLIFIDADTVEQAGWNYSVFYNTGLTREQVDSDKPTYPVNIPPTQERIMLTYFVSGHCTDGIGADEFESKDNVIAIDDTEILRYQPWRDDCENFEDQNGGGGTYWYSRSGWCPGDKVYPVILDVSDQLNSGVHNLSYWIENIRPEGIDGHLGYWRVSSFLTGWGDISTWLPQKIMLIGPAENIFPTETIVYLRLDLVDESGYTIFETDQTVEISADKEDGLFSVDQMQWSNPFEVEIKHGTTTLWFKAGSEGEVTISAQDVDSDPSMQSADDLVLTISNPVANSGNYALQFDGDDDYVNCGNDTSLQITGNQITLEAKVTVNQFKDEVWQGCVVTKDENDAAAHDSGYMIRIGNNGTVNFNLGSSGWNELNTPQNTIELNSLYHIAATYDGSQMLIYVNGIEKANRSINNLNITNAVEQPLLIGDSPQWPGRCFNGKIDEVRLWNIARSQSQIQNTMNDTLNLNYYLTSDSGLVGYWRLNEGEGQFASDLSIQKNHGTLGSSPDSDTNDPLWIVADSVLSIRNIKLTIPNEYQVSQNYPNPFNNETVFHILLPQVTKVHAVIYNSSGQFIRHLLNGQLPRGVHKLRWDSKNHHGQNVASGVYFLNIRFTDSSGNSNYQVRKLVYAK